MRGEFRARSILAKDLQVILEDREADARACSQKTLLAISLIPTSAEPGSRETTIGRKHKGNFRLKDIESIEERSNIKRW